MKIATVINYCSNDYRFLARAIHEAKLFSSEIFVPVCDHFFDGSPENRFLLNQTYQEHPDVHFLEFAYDVKQLYTPYVTRLAEDEDWAALWHSTARYLSFLYLPEEIDWVLFVDADEIIEGASFSLWLAQNDIQIWDALWFFAYQYGFEASARALDWQQTALLVKKSAVSPLQIFSAQERFGLFASLSGPKWMQITGVNGEPMIHHYSWVRPLSECRKKGETWGKRHLCDWKDWLEQKELEKNKFIRVDPFFDPLKVSLPKQWEGEPVFSNVTLIDPNRAFRKGLYVY